MTWSWIIFWVLLAILITGAILLIVGLEAPHKNKPDNTVNYDTLKWIGIALLITSGVGMLIWAYFKFRKNKSGNIYTPLQEPLMESDNFNCNNATRNLKEIAYVQGKDSPEWQLFNNMMVYRNMYQMKNPDTGKANVNASMCNEFKSQLRTYDY
jgi:hypothetical protein